MKVEASMVRDGKILRALINKGYINEGKHANYPQVDHNDDGDWGFVYNNSQYELRYIDGSFYPFLFKLKGEKVNDLTRKELARLRRIAREYDERLGATRICYEVVIPGGHFCLRQFDTLEGARANKEAIGAGVGEEHIEYWAGVRDTAQIYKKEEFRSLIE
jgi:hypothetical protein